MFSNGTALTQDNTNLFWDSTNFRLGLGTAAPTSAITLASSRAAEGFTIYNTSDQVTNYERFRTFFSGNILFFNTENGGTGTKRALQLGVSGSMGIKLQSTAPFITTASTSTNSTSIFTDFLAGFTLVSSSTVQTPFALSPNVTQTSTAGYTVLLVNPTETSTGSGTKLLADFQVGGVSKASISNTGVLFTSSIELGNASDTTLTRASAGVLAVEGVNVLLNGGALGTPSSGTLTNATGLPISGLVASTSTALGVGSVELGNASDTTLSRSSAGVLAVEGVVIPSISSTNTLTNKRITKRVVTASDATSVTPNSDNADITYQLNTQATGTLTMNADGGTPTDGQSWMFRIKSTNAQTFSWNAVFIGGTNALPTVSTGSSKIDHFAFIYSTVNSKWMYTGSAGGF